MAVAAALALASAGALSPAAYAQEEEEPAAEQGTAIGLQVEEILVTAERREETVQRTSLALSVLRAEQLKVGGVTQANDLASLVPGLTISNAGGIVQTYLRGVGSFATDARAEPSIAYNLNGVYIARPAGIGSVFFDLDRVEVLKGPQGTLYGRNASGGAINIITNKPKFEFGASALVEGGNFSDINGQGYVNVPLSDTVAFRLAGQMSERDGYLSDGYDDEDTEAARLMGLWEPSEKFSLLFTGEYTSVGG
jgi:iron complex outermembrane receptor protein